MSEVFEKQLSSTKSYLVRAFYDWIVDNECTPYIVVNAENPDVQVPNQYIENGRIVLNVAIAAVNNLQITKDFINFDARFSGVLREIYVPMQAVLAIYAHENGRGMVFAEDDPDHQPPEPKNPDVADTANKPVILRKDGKPSLKIVK